MYQKSQKQLEQAEKEIEEMKEKLKEAREEWSKALGDAELATKSADDLQKKQKKRWSELTGVGEEPSEETAAGEGIDLPLNIEVTEQARKLAELEHKLKQALENVRQADTVRQSLKEALIMNNTLTTKLDEVKSKYAALQASRSNSLSASKLASNDKSSSNDNSGSLSRDKESRSSSDKIDPSRAEKLHKENRRFRKELAALTVSKEAAKSKLEVSRNCTVRVEMFHELGFGAHFLPCTKFGIFCWGHLARGKGARNADGNEYPPFEAEHREG